jgi:hypothetical protein
MERSGTRYLLKTSIALILGLALVSSGSATFSSLTVGTNSSSWSIYRHSGNLSFDYTQSVQGTVSPIDYNGRSLSPYHSAYQEVNVNDVRLRDRTSAFQGNYSSEEQMHLRSDTTNSISIDITKPGGSPVYTIQYVEQWPVILRYDKIMKYSGKEINEREFIGNNLDYAGSSLLYNKELSKDTYAGLLLKRMNATVLATDDAIFSADFMPSRETIYRTRTHTTGIANLKYRLTGPSYKVIPGIYPALSEGEERYVGNYNITRSIHIKSDFEKSDFENSSLGEDYLPCCFVGYSGMSPVDRGYLGLDAREVFDCSCSKVSREIAVARSEAKESP